MWWRLDVLGNGELLQFTLGAFVAMSACEHAKHERSTPNQNSARAPVDTTRAASPQQVPRGSETLTLRLVAGGERSGPGKRPSTIVSLGTEGSERRVELAEVSTPYVCSLQTQSPSKATVTCTPDFRRVRAWLEIGPAGVRVNLPPAGAGQNTKNSKGGGIAAPPWHPTQDGRPLEFRQSDVAGASDVAQCQPAARKVATVRLASVNYYSGYPPAAQLMLTAPGVPLLKIIDQREPKIRWWSGCNSRKDGASVLIECGKGDQVRIAARVSPDPLGVAFESTIPEPGFGKLSLPCAASVTVAVPECLNCGNLYF
jgi:hypothetical protein